jgi:hypothetical protein
MLNKELEDKYVQWKYVAELLKMISQRDSFHDWSDQYEELDKKVKNTIEWLDRNAITFDRLHDIKTK